MSVVLFLLVYILNLDFWPLRRQLLHQVYNFVVGHLLAFFNLLLLLSHLADVLLSGNNLLLNVNNVCLLAEFLVGFVEALGILLRDSGVTSRRKVGMA